VVVTEAKLKELKQKLKAEKKKATLASGGRKLERLLESAKVKADACGEAFEHPQLYDLAELPIHKIQGKVGLFLEEDLEGLTRDDIIEILQSLVARGIKFNDHFINRDVPIETAKVTGRGDSWFRMHLAGHLGIDMSSDAEHRLLDDAANDMLEVEIDDDDEEEEAEPAAKKDRIEGEFSETH